MTERPIAEPRKLGRTSIVPGESRNTKWPVTLALSEIARLNNLPGNTNPAKIIGALDRLDAVTGALRDVVQSYTDPHYTAEDFGKVIDCARETLEGVEGAR